MNFEFSDEQIAMKDEVRKLLDKENSLKRNRTILEGEEKFDKDLWNSLVSMGLTAVTIPEEFGGSNFGLSGIGIVLQELGRTLTPSPLLATAVIGASFLSKLGTEEQKKRYLPEIVKGNITCCFAFEEGPRHNPIVSETNAEKKGNKFIINGKKTFVIDGGFADLVIIAAKTKNGVSLFIADRDSDGIEINRTKMVDSRNAANMNFENLEIN